MYKFVHGKFHFRITPAVYDSLSHVDPKFPPLNSTPFVLAVYSGARGVNLPSFPHHNTSNAWGWLSQHSELCLQLLFAWIPTLSPLGDTPLRKLQLTADPLKCALKYTLHPTRLWPARAMSRWPPPQFRTLCFYERPLPSMPHCCWLTLNSEPSKTPRSFSHLRNWCCFCIPSVTQQIPPSRKLFPHQKLTAFHTRTGRRID